MENSVTLNTVELKSFLSHIFKTNATLASQNKNPIAVQIVGESGIGKTSSIMQIVKDHGKLLVKNNLAQFEELGDLMGIPIKQYQVGKKDTEGKWDIRWVESNLLSQVETKGYSATGKNRMSYSSPEWVQSLKEGDVILFDDWNRAQLRFIQALMEIVDRGEYISWKLPKGCTVLLSANPDDGEYMVSSIDVAHETRFTSVNLNFDIDSWALWAEKEGIDGRCINFLMLNHDEVITKSTNPRAITNFFNSISTFDSFDKNLPMIQMLGEGSVGMEFASLFTMFINNKLDKLIDPKVMLLEKSEEKVLESLRHSIGVDAAYRADIASVLCNRLVNFTLHHADTNTITADIIARITTLTTHDVFANDLKYFAIRGILNGNKQKFEKLMMNPEIVKMATR